MEKHEQLEIIKKYYKNKYTLEDYTKEGFKNFGICIDIYKRFEKFVNTKTDTKYFFDYTLEECSYNEYFCTNKKIMVSVSYFNKNDYYIRSQEVHNPGILTFLDEESELEEYFNILYVDIDFINEFISNLALELCPESEKIEILNNIEIPVEETEIKKRRL